ncbi:MULTISPECIES: hypothetical protein [Mycobacteriaceae]|jgi:hypothetical protein|uniref:Uncharacterized protein n=2 Tax=Mycobacteriaceae TaxID=1762 RepID=A0A1Y0C6H0_9MYCO|nr:MULTISPECIES: hypothetical protein [Mycobacteriaceae]ART70687.1 hypothetical protein BTO20_21000 [Mycobacterium dioxanotrophicus]UBV13095.1 hypothetical protein H8Z57_19740 [Mycolicibacterium fortuitum]
MAQREEDVVYVKTVATGSMEPVTISQWTNHGFNALIRDAMALFASTKGGTLSITGTPEYGRVTVAMRGECLMDMVWGRMTAAEAHGDIAHIRRPERVPGAAASAG